MVLLLQLSQGVQRRPVGRVVDRGRRGRAPGALPGEGNRCEGRGRGRGEGGRHRHRRRGRHHRNRGHGGRRHAWRYRGSGNHRRGGGRGLRGGPDGWRSRGGRGGWLPGPGRACPRGHRGPRRRHQGLEPRGPRRGSGSHRNLRRRPGDRGDGGAGHGVAGRRSNGQVVPSHPLGALPGQQEVRLPRRGPPAGSRPVVQVEGAGKRWHVTFLFRDTRDQVSEPSRHIRLCPG